MPHTQLLSPVQPRLGGVQPMLHENVDDLCIPAERRRLHWSVAVVLGDLRIGADFKQPPDHLDLAVQNGMDERRLAPAADLVDVLSMFYACLD